MGLGLLLIVVNGVLHCLGIIVLVLDGCDVSFTADSLFLEALNLLGLESMVIVAIQVLLVNDLFDDCQDFWFTGSVFLSFDLS